MAAIYNLPMNLQNLTYTNLVDLHCIKWLKFNKDILILFYYKCVYINDKNNYMRMKKLYLQTTLYKI